MTLKDLTARLDGFNVDLLDKGSNLVATCIVISRSVERPADKIAEELVFLINSEDDNG
jgi:hypothetical protein